MKVTLNESIGSPMPVKDEMTIDSPSKNREEEEVEASFATDGKLIEPVISNETTVERPKEAPLKQKMIITGDDILIEYVFRIMSLLESIKNIHQQKWSVDTNPSSKETEELIPE